MAEATGQQKSEIDEAMSAWRQGDAYVGDGLVFAHWFRSGAPLTRASVDSLNDVDPADVEDIDVAFSEASGFVVVSQTCDIVRSCASRPYIELAALVEVEEQRLREISLLRLPQYAYLPGLADRRLVADLDRVMTVEKAVVAGLERTPGTASDEELDKFAQALARKRARFAFPDAFNNSLNGLHDRLNRRANKDTPEGRHVDALAEIRVMANPSWAAERVSVTYWFIKSRDPDGANWHEWAADWTSLIDQSGAYVVEGTINVVRLDDMTAREHAYLLRTGAIAA